MSAYLTFINKLPKDAVIQLALDRQVEIYGAIFDVPSYEEAKQFLVEMRPRDVERVA